jgi:hypothetical protein
LTDGEVKKKPRCSGKKTYLFRWMKFGNKRAEISKGGQEALEDWELDGLIFLER